MNFFCVGVMYTGEYDACDVTFSIYSQFIYSHRAAGELEKYA